MMNHDVPNVLEQEFKEDGIIKSEVELKSRRTKVVVGTILGIICFTSIVVGVVLGTKNGKEYNSPLRPRLQDGIQIQSFLEGIYPSESNKFQEKDDPLTKAMNWMIFDDPQQLVPSKNASFLQRFVMTHLYYQTSQREDWEYCYPDFSIVDINKSESSTSGSEQTTNNKERCQLSTYSKFRGVDAGFASARLWLSKQDECLWAGNICDIHGHISKISLIAMGLNGPFPDKIYRLAFLQTTTFPANNLTGILPESLAQGKYVVRVAASLNRLLGTIPVTFHENARLVTNIILAKNQFSELNFESLSTDIKKVSFEGSNYSRSLVDNQIERLPSLSDIDLSNTNLSGRIPLALWRSPFLISLELAQNFLTGPIPQQQPSKHLSMILLERNQLTGPIPNALVESKTSPLETLFLAENNLNGTIPENITNLKALVSLLIDHNKDLSGTIPSGLDILENLMDLSFTDTNLTGSVPVDLCNKRDKSLNILRADCAANMTTTYKPKIYCPTGCCTTCCDASGSDCIDF